MSGTYPNLLAGGIVAESTFAPFELWAGEADLVTSQGTAGANLAQFTVVARAATGGKIVALVPGATDSTAKAIGFLAQAAVLNGPATSYTGGVGDHMNRERLPLGAALDLMDDRGFNLHLRALQQLQVANMLVPGDIGDFDTATLIEVLYAPAQAPDLVAFWLKFFPRTIQFDTQEIRFDSEDLNEYRLAPFVAPNVQGRVLRSKGYSVQSFRPAYVKPKHVVDPARSIPRRAGERPFGTLSLQERFDAIVADNLRRERAVIENRWEWMACKALVDATVTVVGEDYPSVTVDFKRDPSLTTTTCNSCSTGCARAIRPTSTASVC
jgi:hypothetical protein